MNRLGQTEAESCNVPPPPPAAVRWLCVTLSLWKSTHVTFEQKKRCPTRKLSEMDRYIYLFIVKHKCAEFTHIENVTNFIYVLLTV